MNIDENKAFWERNFDWRNQGDEWSNEWGGPDMQWYGTILPRIHLFVPCLTILEIAPGYGRWTDFLKDLCERLTIVDLASNCIEACRKRFADHKHLDYHVNDGKSLAMIPDKSVDFAFSFDSLVHADRESIEGYIRDLALKLKPDGVAFIHHSNFGETRGGWSLPNPQARSPDMTAALFEKLTRKAGMQCVSQEIIDWAGGHEMDCMSLFTPAGSHWARPNVVFRNRRFEQEMKACGELAKLYSGGAFAPESVRKGAVFARLLSGLKKQ